MREFDHGDPGHPSGYLTASYDAAGRLSQIVDGLNGNWSFNYDNIGRLKQTTTHYNFVPSRNFTVQYAYDAAGNRVGMNDPENGLTQYTYDALNRLTNLQDFQSHNFGFSYDALSRRTQMTMLLQDTRELGGSISRFLCFVVARQPISNQMVSCQTVPSATLVAYSLAHTPTIHSGN
jgi:YD repeat-containing protein